MARILGLFPSALVAARGNMGANAYYRSLRELDIAARRTEVLQLYKIAKSIVTKSPDEPFRPIDQVPHGNELEPWPVKNPGGIAQTVTLTYRDMVTGDLKQTWWRTVTPNGMTREQAMATAINAYTGTSSGEEQELIGAVHTSARTLVPLELA